jgi:hypothetical protein
LKPGFRLVFKSAFHGDLQCRERRILRSNLACYLFNRRIIPLVQWRDGTTENSRVTSVREKSKVVPGGDLTLAFAKMPSEQTRPRPTMGGASALRRLPTCPAALQTGA